MFVSVYTRKHTATHCSTLQHTATHCNTLQHTRAAPETRAYDLRPRGNACCDCVGARALIDTKEMEGTSRLNIYMYIYIYIYIYIYNHASSNGFSLWYGKSLDRLYFCCTDLTSHYGH